MEPISQRSSRVRRFFTTVTSLATVVPVTTVAERPIPRDTTVSALIGHALGTSTSLPPPLTYSPAVTAFALPKQDNLLRPPPPNAVRILSTRPPCSREEAKGRKAPYAAIPVSQTGGHPIISTARDSHAVHSNNQVNGGFYKQHATYGGAVAHILKHFATHVMPENLCSNCWLFHTGQCNSPTVDWNPLIDSRYHPLCAKCHVQHFPPCVVITK